MGKGGIKLNHIPAVGAEISAAETGRLAGENASQVRFEPLAKEPVEELCLVMVTSSEDAIEDEVGFV